MSTGVPPARDLLGIARTVAREAGELVEARAARGVSVAATKSSRTDVVTEADRASEDLVRRRLAELRPDDAVMGEEGSDRPGSSGVRWVVDPIDGTVNYLYGLPEYAVSLAAELTAGQGASAVTEVVAGVVLNPARGIEYAAWTEPDGTTRSTRDGRPLGVRLPGPLSERLCATGFSYDAELRALQARAWLDLLPRVRDLRRHGSCALELCHVAEGALDAYFEEAVNLWDYAAGALVARGAGARFGTMVGVGGRTFALCAPEAGFDELREAVVAAGFTSASGSAGPSD